MKTARILLIILLMPALLFACNKQQPTLEGESAYPAAPAGQMPGAAASSTEESEAIPTTPPQQPTADMNIYPVNVPLTLQQVSSEVIGALQANDLAKVATYVHPVQGLRFSPYSYINPEDLVFTAEVLPGLLDDPQIHNWGIYDGSGLPIDLAFSDYYAQFVYSADFANADQVAYNQFIGTGNMINNLTDFYPGAEFVEYHFKGFDKQYKGLDWQSLLLVFSYEGGTYYLVGIVHAQWTI